MRLGTQAQIDLKEVIVATDFSDTSLKALSYAKAVARRYKSHLLVMHVNEPLSPLEVPEALWFDDRAADLRRGLKVKLRPCGLRD